MANINLQIDITKYGGFTSYGQGQVSTLKPGLNNNYNKDVYNQISEYNKRYIPYFNDKQRYKSVYKEEIIETVDPSSYNQIRNNMQKDLNNYQYKHEPTLLDIFKENSMKNEETVRSNL